MTEIELEITNSIGLHARPAAQLVQKAASFQSKVKIGGNNKVADGKSILGVLSLGLAKGAKVYLAAEGIDEKDCIASLKTLLEENFGESK